MTAEDDDGASPFDWGYLIKPDKSPAPHLEQLCLGIANIILNLETTTTACSGGITPERLAAFYRAVGGNYDTLFLSTPRSSLSFIYQSMGCFHTLQPTANAFEPPSIPTLLPLGFVRWQTIQLLLCPDEHAGFLQEAVKRFDIVSPATSAVFSTEIPRTAFPAQPDAEMTRWHETVSKRLESEYEDRKSREENNSSQNNGQHREPREHDAGCTRASSRNRTFTERDYFSQNRGRHTNRSSRPRTPSSEAYSPFSGPRVSRSHERAEETPGLDHRMPKYYHIDPDDDQDRYPARRRRRPSRPSSSDYTRPRGRVRTPSSSQRNRGQLVDSSQSEDNNDDDVGEGDTFDETGPESPAIPFPRQRQSASRSADGREQRRRRRHHSLRSRVLSPEPRPHHPRAPFDDDDDAIRRHSHDPPFSARNRSSSSRRRMYPQHQQSPLHPRMHVETLSSDADSPRRRHYGFDPNDDDDEDGEDIAHLTPETKRAHDYYCYSQRAPHHTPSRRRSAPDDREYIVLPSPSSTTSKPSPTTSSNLSPSSPPTTTATTTQRTPPPPPPPPTRSHTPKYKEYILIEPEPEARLYPRRASASVNNPRGRDRDKDRDRDRDSRPCSRSHSRPRYRQGPVTITAPPQGAPGPGVNGNGGGMRHPHVANAVGAGGNMRGSRYS